MPNLIIPIKCGKTTCASAPGEFCEHLSVRRFSTVYACALFGVDVEEDVDSGWLQRCTKCLKHEERKDDENGNGQ